MHQTASNEVIRDEAPVGLVRSVGSAVALGATATALSHPLRAALAADAPGLDDAVAAVALAGGTLAAAVLALGTALLALGRLGSHARVLGRVGRALTPAVLRRALAAGLGLSLGLAAPALADQPPDLGWQVTETVGVTAEPSPEPVPAAQPGEAAGAGAATPSATPAPAPTAAPTPEPTPVATAAPAAHPPATEPVAVAPPAALRPARPSAAPPALTHTVRAGECLWSIAAAHLPTGASEAEIAAAWPRWYAANRTVVGADPDLVLPGQVLRVPDGAHR